MKKTVFIKIHMMDNKQFLSCCDSDLIGKKFVEGKICLRIVESYYKGDELTLETATELIREKINIMDSVHIIGHKINNMLHEKQIIDKRGAKKVQHVPHLMLIKM